MPSALKFVGGGLLQGVGKGLVLSGKEKRGKALADLENQRQVQRDERLLEGRRGLLADTNEAASARLETNIESREGTARAATESRERLASEATESREGIAAAANVSREKAATITANRRTKATDTTAAEDRIIKRHVQTDEISGIETVDHEAAAVELEDRGFKKAAAAQRRKGKGIADLGIRKRAEEFADKLVEEQAGALSFDSSDFKDDGGSRVQFRARMVREFIAKNSGTAPAAPATRPATTEPPAARPEAPNTVPYVGDAQPPDFPDAKRASDGFWYVTRDGKTLRVQQPKAKRRRVR